MVEVFKTDVAKSEKAQLIVEAIHAKYPQYNANFDLNDCDNILRIECNQNAVNNNCIIELLNDMEVNISVLQDNDEAHIAIGLYD